MTFAANPAWGLPIPEGVQAKAAFGARTILASSYGLDFVPDRHQGTGEASDKFKKFVDNMAKHFDKLAKKGQFNSAKDEEHRLDEGNFHAIANTNASYGYVYIIAWEE